MLIQDRCHHTYSVRRAFVLQPKQKNTMMSLSTAKDKLAEILVVGDNNALLGHRSPQDVRVVGLGHCFSNGQNVMASITQICDYRYTRGFIDDEVHKRTELRRNGERKNVLMR